MTCSPHRVRREEAQCTCDEGASIAILLASVRRNECEALRRHATEACREMETYASRAVAASRGRREQLRSTGCGWSPEGGAEEPAVGQA